MAFAALFSAPIQADDLHYFKNYFVTGDYTVAGVGLFGKGVNGLATGKITVPGIPAHADIVAAFLYWQTIETTTTPSITTGTFDGNPIVGASLGATNAAACWSQGGTSPNAFARVYRADVLRYLPIDSTFNVRVADSIAHTVVFADSGNSLTSVTPHTEGASLVVIYRTLGVGSSPYKAVVIYDGADTEDKFTSGFSQVIGGFYQASGPGRNNAVTAKMTHIVGNGQPNFTEKLLINNTQLTVSSTVISGTMGTRWDNPTFNITLPPNAASVTTQVLGTNNQVCLSWGAVVMSTNVVNSDGDGLLDIWKTSGLHLNIGNPGSPAVPATSTTPFVPAVPAVPATFGTCADAAKLNDQCEDLPHMGAKSGEKDVFIQFDWMTGSDGHKHVPKLAALEMLADVFKLNNIFMHFDVGSHYQVGGWPFIIPMKYARGGQEIQEAPLLCVPSATVTCEFPNYPVLGWKSGFDAIANGYTALNIPAYFPHDRKDIFYYALFSHALSGPFTTPPATKPYSVSGVGDAPGGDLMVSLGLWPQPDPANCSPDDPNETTTNLCVNQTGTVLIQAGTLMHELGHNMGLRHAGTMDEPNCMPNYPSVMNYLYQTRGLTDAFGNEHVDFSFGLLNGLNENSLSENSSFGIMLYRTRYYAPPNAAESAAGSYASAHCDGTPVNGYQEVRLETPSVQIPDWNHDGTTQSTPVAVDINFNGTVGSVSADSIQPTDANASDPNKLWFVDHNDWSTLNLQQIGARSNVNGLSADVGQKDLGQKDLGQKDLGQKDLGQKDLGQKDLGQKDLGQSNLGDVDYDTAVSTLDATGSTRPLTATVTAAVPATIATTGVNQITLRWGPPSLGSIQQYDIYRTNLSASPVPLTAQHVGFVTVLSVQDAYAFTDNITDGTLADSGSHCDPSKMCYNANYQYYITATDGKTVSTPSNFAMATVDHLYVTGYTSPYVYNGTTLPDLSANGASYAGLPSGAISSSTPGLSCSNTNPAGTPRNVGSYTITCSGPSAVLNGGVYYGVTYIPGTLMIIQRPITVTAATDTRIYNGTTSSTGTPTITTGSLGTGDTTANFVQSFSSRNVALAGSGTLTPSGVVNDGNSGANYSYVFVTTGGTINPKPITVTAASDLKTYDGTPVSTGAPTFPAGSLATDDTTTNFIQVFDSWNAGARMLIPSGIVNDGNGGHNYAYNFVNNSGTINQRAITVTAATDTKTYDSTTSSGGAPTITTGSLAMRDTKTSFSQVFDSPNVGARMLIPSGIVIDGNSGGNYAYTFANTAGAINPAALNVIVTAFGPPPGYTFTGFLGSDTSSLIAGTLSCAALGTDANNNVTISCSGLSAPNYVISYSYAAADTSSPGILTVFVQGTQTFGGTPVFTPTYSGFISPDTLASAVTGTLACVTEAKSSSAVGTSPAIDSCSGLSSTSYTITYVYGSVTILPAPLTIVVTSASPSVTVATPYTGLVNGDSDSVVTGTLTCKVNTAADSAGDKTISCSGLTAPSYYAISYSYAAAKVGTPPAPLTISVTGTQTGASGTPTFTATFSGFVGGDLPSDVAGTLSCTTVPGPTALTRKISVCTGLSAPVTYAITYVLGNDTVKP